MNALALDPHLATRALAGPGGDAPEGPLREATRLAEANDYAQAAERSARLLASGVTDVRPLAYFLFGVFLEQGPGALGSILELLTEVFGSRWPTARPETRKAQVAVGASSWLLRTMVQHIDFHAAQDDATFRGWRSGEAAALAPLVSPKFAALRAVLADQPAASRVTDMLSELEARVRSHFSRPAPRKAPPAAPVREPAPAPAPVAPVEEPPPDEEPPLGWLAAMDLRTDVPAAAPPTERAPVVAVPNMLGEASPALQLLLRKLAVFEQLIARGDLLRAGVAAADIQHCVTHFDPKSYFPKLFTTFFRLLAIHAADLGQHAMATDEGTVRALEQLYAVDLEAFAEP